MKKIVLILCLLLVSNCFGWMTGPIDFLVGKIKIPTKQTFNLDSMFAHQDTITIGVVHFPPLSIHLGDNKFKGFNIDYLDSIQKDLGVVYKYEWVDSFLKIFPMAQANEKDLFIGGITITGEREKIIDNSQPYIRSGLTVVTRNEKGLGPIQTIIVYCSDAWPAIKVLGIFMIICSIIIYLLERGKPSFDDRPIQGIADGAYWTNTTSTSTGYGDKTPMTVAGKVFAVLVMWIGIYFISPYFIAQMSSTFDKVKHTNPINSYKDLKKVRVAVKGGSTSVKKVKALGAIPVEVPSINDSCFEILADSIVDAIVYDNHPIVHYLKTKDKDKRFRIAGEMFDPQDYGIVFPAGSRWKEEFDIAGLKFKKRAGYKEIHDKWLKVE